MPASLQQIKSAPPLGTSDSPNSVLLLQAQLRRELPIALALFERGFGLFVAEFAWIQREFWREGLQRWRVLKEGLPNPGHAGGIDYLEIPDIAYKSSGHSFTDGDWVDGDEDQGEDDDEQNISN